MLHGLLARMREEGVTAGVTEVSSHAAALDRISGVDFAVAVFTNLQWDHLDFHVTMEGYLDAKARLFEPGRARRGIINIDDEWGRLLAGRVKIPVQTVSTLPSAQRDADWVVTFADVGLDGVGSTFTFRAPDGGSTRRRARYRGSSMSPTRWSRSRPRTPPVCLSRWPSQAWPRRMRYLGAWNA